MKGNLKPSQPILSFRMADIDVQYVRAPILWPSLCPKTFHGRQPQTHSTHLMPPDVGGIDVQYVRKRILWHRCAAKALMKERNRPNR